jgi:plasmid stabilization system protein ParE
MRPRYRFRILGGAQADQEELEASYEAARPGHGVKFAERVQEFVESILVFPRMYSRVRRRSDPREIRIGALRQFPVVVEYVIEGDEIIIQYLKHGRRDYRRFLRRRRG